VLNYTFRRVVVAVPTLIILIALTFLLMEAAPGSPFATERGTTADVLANLEAKYGLDRPMWQRMGIYIWNVVTAWDFGPSYIFKDRDVNDIIAQGFPVTLKYGAWSFVVAVVMGVGLGVLAAVRHNTWADYLAVGVSIGAQVLPNFVLAPILILIFTLWLDLLPGGGWRGGQWQYLIMPVIALSTSYMASIARITRASMLEVLNSNFIRTARAKGLPASRVILRHALKPAMLPVVSYLGPAFVGMITGSVVIDMIFSTGGIGQFFAKAALSRDYGVMLGLTVLIGALTVIFNLVVDVLYAWIDPRIRY
jgi:oligopeptide transport system permease protein